MKQCSGEVFGPGGVSRMFPCGRDASVTRDGNRWCWQHDPEYVQRKQLEAKERWRKDDAERAAYYHRKQVETTACDGIPTEVLESGLLKRLYTVYQEVQDVDTAVATVTGKGFSRLDGGGNA